MNIAWGLWGSCKTLIAVGWLTRWKQTFPLVPRSYGYCDDRKSDRCQRDPPRQLVIPHAQIWSWVTGWRVGEVPTFIFLSAEREKWACTFRLTWRKDTERNTNRDSEAQTMAQPAKMVAKAVIKKWTLIGTLPNLHVLILLLVNVHKTAMVLPGPRLLNGCWGRDAAGLFRWTCGAKPRHLVSINPFVNGYKIISHLLCWKQGRTLLASQPMNEERLSKSI